MLGSSSVATQFAASQEGLSSMKLVMTMQDLKLKNCDYEHYCFLMFDGKIEVTCSFVSLAKIYQSPWHHISEKKILDE
jgi:hypothetical protein